MHEYAMMEAILHDATAEADRRRAVILGIHVELGELAGISPESLETAFTALTKGTPLEGSRLEITEVPGRVQCDACGLAGSSQVLGLEAGHSEPLLVCPRCGYLLAAVEGRGVLLRHVTLQVPDANRVTNRSIEPTERVDSTRL